MGVGEYACEICWMAVLTFTPDVYDIKRFRRPPRFDLALQQIVSLTSIQEGIM